MQEVIVYIIGLLVALYIGVKVYRFFVRRDDPCRGCAGCDVKNLYEAKRMTCKPKTKKKSGGCGCGGS